MKMILRRNTVPMLDIYNQYSIHSEEEYPVSVANNHLIKSRRALLKSWVEYPVPCSKCWTQDFFISDELPVILDNL